MRRRIVRVSVVAALAALVVLSVPLAVAVHRLYVSQARGQLEQVALRAEIGVDPQDLAGTRLPPAPNPQGALGLYDLDGRRVAGSGPVRADEVVQASLRGPVAQQIRAGTIMVSLPVRDDDLGVVAAVRASVPDRVVWERTARAVAATALLGLLALLAAVLVARRQAALLSRPMEGLAVAAQALGDGDFSARAGQSGVEEVDRVAQALATTADRLAALLERERSLADDASHQLRTPLTGLQLRLESALNGSGEDLRPALESALQAARRLGQTVDDLLSLRHPPPARERRLPTSADELASGVLERWSGICAAAGRPLNAGVDGDAPDTSASPPAVRQVLDVLLDNALKHGAGRIRVRLRDAGGALAVDVGDDGSLIGLPSDQLFRRGESATGSTGIGLSLASSLVQSDGGRLVLSGRRPTTFTALLPPVEDGG